jgi:hypothetical protein
MGEYEIFYSLAWPWQKSHSRKCRETLDNSDVLIRRLMLAITSAENDSNARLLSQAT